MANTVQKIILNTDIRTLSLLAGFCLHTVFVYIQYLFTYVQYLPINQT